MFCETQKKYIAAKQDLNYFMRKRAGMTKGSPEWKRATHSILAKKNEIEFHKRKMNQSDQGTIVVGDLKSCLEKALS